MTKILEYEMITAKIMEVDHQLEEDSIVMHHKPQKDPFQSLIKQSESQVQGVTQISNKNHLIGKRNEPIISLHSSHEVTQQLPLSQILYSSSAVNQSKKQSQPDSRIRIDMTASVNKYFEGCGHKIKEVFVCKQNDVLSVAQKIKEQISSGEVKINQKSRHLSFQKSNKQGDELSIMRQLELKKWQTIKKLKQIEQDEANLFCQIKKPFNRGKSVYQSVVTEENSEKISNILKIKKQFEDRQRQKSLEFVNSIQQKAKRQEEQEKLERMRQNQKKKERIGMRLKELQARHELRQEMIKNSVVREKHTYAHIELQKQLQEIQKQQKKQVQNKLREIHLKHQLNIQQINDHDRNYSIILEERTSREPVNVTSRISLPKREKTYYDRLVEEQLFQQKQRNYQEIMKVKQHRFKQKIQQFQQKVQEEHRPILDPSKRITVIPRSYSSVSLSKQERDEKGLQYLAKAKDMKRCISEANPKPLTVEPIGGNKRYMNYMKERERANFDPAEREFKQIINSKQESQKYQSVLRAKYLAEGLQAKSKKPADDKLYFAIKNKLSLLEGLY